MVRPYFICPLSLNNTDHKNVTYFTSIKYFCYRNTKSLRNRYEKMCKNMQYNADKVWMSAPHLTVSACVPSLLHTTHMMSNLATLVTFVLSKPLVPGHKCTDGCSVDGGFVTFFGFGMSLSLGDPPDFYRN